MTNSAEAKLGVLTVGRKRPGFDQQWNQVMRGKAVAALGAAGVRTAGEEQVVVDEPSTRLALDYFRDSGCSTLLVLQPSLGNGQLAMSIAQRWDGPIVLWATPERPDGQIVSSCSLVAQHLWASLLRQLRRPFEFVYGDPDDQRVRRELADALSVCRALAGIRSARAGILGAHAPGFIAMEADPFLMQSQLGVQLHRLSLPQFFDRVGSISQSAVREDVERVRTLGLPMEGVSPQDLPLNSRYYLALRDLMAEESLDAVAVQDWPEFAQSLGQWPYLAMSRLTDEGRIVTMECDVDGAIISLAGQMLGAGFGFLTDWLEHDDRTIHFWHAGMAPIGWCKPAGSNDGARLGRHFNIDKPLVVDGALRADQPMTIARLWRVDNRYFAMAFEGKTINNPRLLTGNTALMQVSPETIPATGVRGWFDQLLHAGLPHHVALFQGRHRELFRRLMRMMQVEWIG